MKEDENVRQAKKSLKAHIKFLETILAHLNKTDPALKSRAMWASFCLHRYINDGLIKDIESAMRENSMH